MRGDHGLLLFALQVKSKQCVNEMGAHAGWIEFHTTDGISATVVGASAWETRPVDLCGILF